MLTTRSATCRFLSGRRTRLQLNWTRNCRRLLPGVARIAFLLIQVKLSRHFWEPRTCKHECRGILAITLLGKEIRPSQSAKDLGVVVDEHLSFNEHVTDLVSKCTASLYQINRVKHLFDKSTPLIATINSLVFSKCFTVRQFGPVQQRKALLEFRKCKILRLGLPPDKKIWLHHPHIKATRLVASCTIVNWVEWLWNPSDSFVICFCGPESAQRSKEFLSFWLYWPIKTLH